MLTALVGGTIAALLAGLVYIETDKGTLVIDSTDDSVKVTISKALDPNGEGYMKFRVVDTVTGSSVVRLPSGAYEVSLDDDSNEYKLNEEGFTLSRGGDVVVTVTRDSEMTEKEEVPALVAMPVPRGAHNTLYLEGSKLSAEQVRELETKLEKDPNDIVSRLKVMAYYSRKSIMNVDARQPHLKLVRWFVQNYPEFDHNTMHIHAHSDPGGYVEIKNRWLETVDRYPTNTRIMSNAASFFLQSDRELAISLVEKCLALEPKNPEWSARLGEVYSLGLIGAQGKQQRQILGRKACEHLELAIQLSDSPPKTSRLMVSVAKAAMAAGQSDKAKGYAEQLLKQGGNAQDYAGAIHHGNTILGRIALQSGDIPKAKTHLLASGSISSSPVLGSFGPRMLLANELLEKGETEVVIEYFERCRSFWKMGADRLDAWEKAVKAGLKPDFGPNLTR